MDGIPEKLALIVDDTTLNSRQALSSSFSTAITRRATSSEDWRF